MSATQAGCGVVWWNGWRTCAGQGCLHIVLLVQVGTGGLQEGTQKTQRTCGQVSEAQAQFAAYWDARCAVASTPRVRGRAPPPCVVASTPTPPPQHKQGAQHTRTLLGPGKSSPMRLRMV